MHVTKRGVDTALIITVDSTDEELRQLCHALKGTLGTAKHDSAPKRDDDWRSGWAALAELGVTAFCVPEAKGGFGFRVDAAVATAKELGAALHGSPYAGLATSAYVLADGADGPETGELLAGMLTGQRICAFGRLSRDGRVARLVDGALESDALLLEQSASCLLLLDPGAWTATASRHGFDVSRTCADVLVDPGRGLRTPMPAFALDLHELLLAADALGGVQRMLDRTISYAGQRCLWRKR